jgi:hypothetical protein
VDHTLDIETDRRSDVLYTEEMNKEFYKQKLTQAINETFEESAKIQKDTLVHPKNRNLKAKNVFSLTPSSELLGQSIFDIYLGNKLEKSNEGNLLNEEGLMAQVGFNEFQEKTLKLFKKKKDENLKEGQPEASDSDSEKRPPSIKESLDKVGEYGVLRKKLGEKDNQKMLLMIVNNEDSAEIKEVDFSMFLRNVKKFGEPEELVLEEDLEEEARFKKQEQEEVNDLDSFLLKRLSQLYPSTEGILWDKPHPPSKIHTNPKSTTKDSTPSNRMAQEVIPEEDDESLDSLFND